VKGFEENSAVFAPNARSAQESAEEKHLGVLSETEAEILTHSLESSADPGHALRTYLKTHRLTCVATDRNVLNLPGIGKSMTFQLIGYTPKGHRILRFDHDPTRRHSPIIHRIGKVDIVENRTVASYLRRLVKLGENPEDYATIWNYTRSQTERRFPLYRYPELPFEESSFEELFKAAPYADPED